MYFLRATYFSMVTAAATLALTGCALSDEPPTEPAVIDFAQLEVQVEDDSETLAMGASELADVRFYVVEREAAETGVIRGFRSEEARQKYLDSKPAAELASSLACDPNSYFYEHNGFAGNYLAFSQPNTQIGYLPDYGFNDRISSVLTTMCGGFTTLFEHKFYGGSSITFGPGLAIPRLGDFSCGFFCSWNDQASSLSVSF